MLVFDGECDVLSLDLKSATDADTVLDSLEAPHVTLRQDGLSVREQLIQRTLRTVRLTKGGGLFLCKDDDIVVQSMDVRSVAHIVPLVLTRGVLVRPYQTNVLAGVPQSWQQQLEASAASLMARPVAEETVVRTALAMTWPRRMGEPLASLVLTADGSDAGDMVRSGSFRGANSSTSSILSPFNASQHSSNGAASLLRTVGGATHVASVRTNLIEATDKAESAYPLHSLERARRIADRTFVIDFLTRKQALKFFEAVHSILEQHQLPLTLPPEPRYIPPIVVAPRQRQPSGAFGEGLLMEDLPPANKSGRRRRLLSVMGRAPERAQGNDAEGDDAGSDHSGGSSTGGAASDRSDGESSDDGDNKMAGGGGKAATETSTHLRDMFERDDDDFDEEREAELDKRRRMRDEPLSDKATLDAMPEDNLKKASTAVAQEMIERLTAMKVVIKSPFYVTDAFVENSAAQQEERRVLRMNAASMINSQFPAAAGMSPSSLEPQDESSPMEILTFQRLERSKNPVPLLEALRARKPEHFTKEGASEFFHLCRDLYRKEREVLSHRAMTLGMLRRDGLDSMKYFTGPAVRGLFQSWALQRRREGYQLQQYLVDLTQYVWFIKRCEAVETTGTSAAARSSTAGYAAASPGDAETGTTPLAAGASTGDATAFPSDDDGRTGTLEHNASYVVPPPSVQALEADNPLALYTSASSMREQLEHCRLLHVELELILAQRKARYDAAGVTDPLFASDSDDGRNASSTDGGGRHGKGIGFGRRHRSNVFPDQVAERLGASSIIATSAAATIATSSVLSSQRPL